MFKVGVGSKSASTTGNGVTDVEIAGGPSPDKAENVTIQNAN